MTFAHPHYLWLLLVFPPAVVLFLWWSARLRQELMARFIHPRLLPGLVAGVSAGRNRIRAACLVLSVACLLLALAQPQWGHDLEEVRQRGLDIVIAIDTSKSMLAEDIPPNRLARAKLAALDLMHQARSDRLGLVAFAGSAFLQCPLTFDDAAFRQSLQALDVDTIPEGGTALAGAIQEAAKSFKEGDNYKVLVLFTDGEDHDPGALEAAQKAAAAGLRIFTIGIGSVEGELLRIKTPNGQSDYIRDENGNVVKSRLNQALLQEIAGAASGFYLPLSGAQTIDTLYQKGLAPLPKSEAREKWVRRPHERYHWPLGLGIILLSAEILLPERKNNPNRERRSTEMRAATVQRPGIPASVLLIFLVSSIPVLASPNAALREYKAGRYDQALRDYEQWLQHKGDDPRGHFNAGAAAYKNRRFDQAAKHFDEALSAQDLQLQQQAYYNLGNSLYRLGEQVQDPKKKMDSWQNAVKHFDSAMKLNTNDADAMFNYEFVKKQLEELKKQQQQQDQNKNQDQNQDQQKQNDQQNNKSKDQQQNSKSQQQQQQDQQQKRDQDQSKQQQAQNQKPEEEKAPQPKPGQESSDQKQQQAQQDQQQQPQKAAVGQMTPQEAQRVLDSQKNDEQMLPVSRKQQPADVQRVIRDW